jgi:Zn-dependent protease
MLRFQLFGFPVRVDPWFWLVAALLGGATRKLGQPGGGTEVLLWVGMVFVSILWHELGHAFAMRRFGSRAEIFLYAGGGLAAPSPGRFSRKEDFFVSAAGPAAGLLLGLAVWLYQRSWPPESYLTAYAITQMLWINVIWSLVNCLPALPLDGGHMLRALLGGKEKIVALCGIVCCAGMMAYALIRLDSIFVAIMFGLFLYQNVQYYKSPWQQPRPMP